MARTLAVLVVLTAALLPYARTQVTLGSDPADTLPCDVSLS